MFNLSGRGAVGGALAPKVFQTVDKLHTACHSEKYDNSDSACFSNYLALLDTMQNQVFFSQKQDEKLASWIKLAVDGSGKLVYLLDKALGLRMRSCGLAAAQWTQIGSPHYLKYGADPTIKDENALELQLEAATGATADLGILTPVF